MTEPALVTSNRIASMDQFRGYTVAGMFLVNFVGELAAIHAVLKHNDNYFSYADSIMPSFIFCVGFSYRLTILRRLPQLGAFKTYSGYFRRSVALILVSLMVFGWGSAFEHWKQFGEIPRSYGGPKIEASPEIEAAQAAKKAGDDAKEKEKWKERKARREKEKEEAEQEPWYKVEIPNYFWLNWRVFLLSLLKADLWEVLSIIAVCQIFIMPVIAAPSSVRGLALVGCVLGHTAMTHNFNWDFENGLDRLYRVVDTKGEEKIAAGLGGLVDVLKNDNLPPEKALEIVEYMGDSVTLPDGRVVEVLIERNWMDRLWQLRGKRAWDGGFFGVVSWSIAMLAGTLVYDLMARSQSSQRSASVLFVWGAVLMIVGYGASCLSRLYDLEQVPGLPAVAALEEDLGEEIKDLEKERDKNIGAIPKEKSDDEKKAVAERLKKETEASVAEVKKQYEAQIAKIKEENKKGSETATRINEGYYDKETGKWVNGLSDRRDGKLAASPVVPDWSRAEGRAWTDLLATAPFVQPPSSEPAELRKGEPVRIWNYWMMGKRTVNQSFMAFALGFAIFLYGIFVLLCDVGSLRVGVFRTFGMNPLAAYVIHEVTMVSIKPLVPEDSPVWFCVVGFLFFFTVTYLLVRGLEKQKIYVRM